MSASQPLIISAEAEAASALLFRTLGAHRAAIAALKPRPVSRLSASTNDDPVQDRCQATLVRILSITEAFTSDLLSNEVDLAVSGATSSNLTLKLADDAVIMATSSWAEQQKAYKDLLGVKENWTAVEQLAEARNAVAHGLGRLTRRQRRKEQSVISKLRAAGITVANGRVLLTEENLADAASVCREHIERIDLAVQRRRAK